jgi:hypothetical protein
MLACRRLQLAYSQRAVVAEKGAKICVDAGLHFGQAVEAAMGVAVSGIDLGDVRSIRGDGRCR